MSEKYLKIFNLSKDFSKVQLENEYQRLLEELNTKDIDDQLKSIFLEERNNINKYYQILLEDINSRENKVNSSDDNKHKDSIKRNINRKNKFKKSNKSKQKNILFLTLIIFIIISILVVFLTNDLKKYNEYHDLEQISCEIIFNGLIFKDNGNEKEIHDSSILMNCFKNGYIQVNNKGLKKYRISGDSKIELSTNNNEFIEIKSINELNQLISLIKNSQNQNVKKQVQDAIRKILNYQKITSVNGLGLKGGTNKWQLTSDYKILIMSSRRKVFDHGFKSITGDIKQYIELDSFLKDKLPLSVYKSIISINNKTYALEKERLKFKKIELLNDTMFNLDSCKTINDSYDWEQKIQMVIGIQEEVGGKGKPNDTLLHTEMGNGVDNIMGTHKWHASATNDINDLILETNNYKKIFLACMCEKCLTELNNPHYIIISKLINRIEKKVEYSRLDSLYKLNEIKNKLELKSLEQQITQDLNENTKTKYCTTIRGSYFWKLKLKNLKKSKSVKNKVLKRNSFLKQINKKVEKFQNCYCEKCKDELSNKALKEIINVFLNNNNYENE